MNKRIVSLALLLTLLSGCANTTPETPEDEPSKKVVEDVDVVANTHINLSDEIFNKVMTNKATSTYDPACSDFNSDGVERMMTKYDYAPNDESDVFTNYVDGDTTQFSSFNGGYTVKVRYLAIDTPESTSEVDEWGKSASNFNKETLKAAKHVIVQSATSAKTGGEGEPDLDGYNRSLAYVWYTTVESPTKNDFRNLNLELVYQGYSIFSGAKEDMEDSFYNAFTQANEIASYYKRHIYSDEEDPNYYYGSPKTLGLDEIYDESLYTNKDDNNLAYSTYCDAYTRWTFEGVVSRKVGNSFYLQDKIDGKYYGLYVFSLRRYAPVQIGNRLKVTGVLSWYGGAYELTGISYSMFNSTERDIQYVTDANGKNVTEEVKPVEITPAQLQKGEYNGVLVTLKDPDRTDNSVYFGTTWSTYGTSTTSYAYGGSEEVNTYNDAYPFYNTDNSMVLFGHFGSKMSNVSSFSTLTGTADYIRVKVPSDLNMTDPATDQIITSYSYYSGTTNASGKEIYHYYVSKNAPAAKALSDASARYASGTTAAITEGDAAPTDTTGHTEGDVYVVGGYNTKGASLYEVERGDDGLAWTEVASDTIIYRTSYKAKKVDSLTGIAMQYESSSGNTKYSINIASANDDFANYTEVA